MATAAATRGTTARVSPYVGPRPFTREDVDAGLELQGRERDVEHLLDLLISKRIVLLYSPSGAGKTSLIHAKLVPTLERENFRVLPVVRVGLRPHVAGAPAAAGGANRYVLSTLQRLETMLPEERRTPAAELGELGLPGWFERLGSDDAAYPLLVFDQFEEVLTADPTDRPAKEEFFGQLGEVLRDRGRWALFAVREDFVGALDPYVRLLPTRLASRYRLDLLDEAGALNAVAKPAEDAGVPFDPAAARELVDELRLTQVERPDGTTETVKGPYVEPVQLQVVCQMLWQHLPPDVSTISVDHLRKFGDVNRALVDFYVRTLAVTSRQTRVGVGALRRWFGRELITSGGTRGLVYRGADRTGQLPNAAVDVLEREHLIRAESRAGARWYELTHDRFVEPIRTSNADWERRHWGPGTWLAIAAAVVLLVVGVPGLWFFQQRQLAAVATQQQVTLTAVATQQQAELAAAARQSAATSTAVAVENQATRAVEAVAAQTVEAVAVQTAGDAQTAVAVQGEEVRIAAERQRAAAETATEVAAVAATATARLAPSPTPRPPTATRGAPTTRTPLPQPTPTPVPAVPAAVPTQIITVGKSVNGQPLVATRFGGGPRRLGVIGSLHGGDERPAYELLSSLPDALRTGQLKVPAGLTLYLLPTLNPDDLGPKTGFNARGVDLNRNFPTLWTAATCGLPDGRYRRFGGCKATGGGAKPFSEPETQAAAALVEGQHLSAVLVVSSGLNSVFSRNGGAGWGEELALDVSREFQVSYVRSCCSAYPVSGQLVDWADSLALRAVEVNAPAGFLGARGRDMIDFVMQRVAASAATCTPTARTGEFALKADAGESFQELGVINPGEGATVKKWSRAKDDDAPTGDPWLYVEVTRPNDGRKGWMFTRESNGARPLCDFDLDDPATYSFPRE